MVLNFGTEQEPVKFEYLKIIPRGIQK